MADKTELGSKIVYCEATKNAFNGNKRSWMLTDELGHIGHFEWANKKKTKVKFKKDE